MNNLLVKAPPIDIIYPIEELYFAKAQKNDKGETQYQRITEAHLGEKIYIILKSRKFDILQLTSINIRLFYCYDNQGRSFPVQQAGKEREIIFAKIGQKDKSNNFYVGVSEITLYSNDEEKMKTLLKKAPLNIFLEFGWEKRDLEKNVCFIDKIKESGYYRPRFWYLFIDDWFKLLKPKVAPWMEIAHKEIGISDTDKVNGGFDRVKKYYKEGANQNLDPIGNPWCASFANWVLIETNKVKGTNFSFIPLAPKGNPAWAFNFVSENRYPNKKIIPANEKPPYGAIMIIKKEKSKEGHAGFVANYIETNFGFIIISLGGNQKGSVCYQKFEFIKNNNKYMYNDFLLRGFVLPKEYIFDTNDKRYYDYEDINATSGSIR